MESPILNHSFSSSDKTIVLDSPSSCGILTLAMKKAYPIDVLETPSNSGSSSKTFSDEKQFPAGICLEILSHTIPRKPEGASSFDCQTCNQIFPCKVALKVHQQEHSLPNVQQFSSNRSNQNPPRRLLSISYACHICDKKGFTTRELLVEHANVHLFGHLCQDEMCQQLYGNRYPPANPGLLDSSKSKTSIQISTQPEKNDNADNKVDTSTPTRSPKLPALIKARRNSSKNEPCIVNVHGRKRFQCTVCHKLLSSKLSHEEHFRGVHTNFKPYSCSVCAKSFAVKNTYRQHILAHSLAGSRSSSSAETSDNNNSTIRILHYQCSSCGENFPSSQKLDYHSCTNRNPNNRNSKPNSTSINNNNMNHNNSKRAEVFRCKIFGCEKVFSRKEWRTKHYLSTHGGESCFRCDICHELFVDEQFYLIHAQVHFKKSLLNCNVCNRTFPGKDLYERHSCRFAGVGSSG